MARIQLVEPGDAIPAVAEVAILSAGALLAAPALLSAATLLADRVLREALGREVRELDQLARQIACVGDDALALAPDAIGVQIELVHALLGDGRHVSGVARGLLAMVVSLALRRGDDLVGRVVRLLEDVCDLVADAFQSGANGRVGRLLPGLQISDLAVQLRDVSVDLLTVITPSRGLEQPLPAPRQLFAHRVKANRCAPGMRVSSHNRPPSGQTACKSPIQLGLMPEPRASRLPEPDRPWVMRTYAGHSDARRSNELYRRNLDKGQTGLSIAFDLPTQTGYDPDHVLARGEVGKVGVSIAHRGDMATLLEGIPLDRMNTSMTINATAAWLLSLYVVAAEEQGIDQQLLQGTTQNDILKEYLSRGTYAFPPAPSLRLIADTIAYTVEHVPKWNPINICSYHLQEAGATPVQEIAYAMSNAIAVLDAVRERLGQRAETLMPEVFGRISFFVNAGVRFIEEHAKLRAMSRLWDELGRERYGVTDERKRRFRYGVQVNSLGLTEAQPENNVYRIALEALAVTLGRDARARALQLPAWNEALGLPRPWDQQWSLRLQQILAYETDLLEYGDIFEGSVVMDALVAELLDGARAEMERVATRGGAVESVEYMKAALVESHRERWARIEKGEQTVVGMNRFQSTEPSPLTAGADGGILVVDPAVERERRDALEAWRRSRDAAAVAAALQALSQAAQDEAQSIMPASIAAARAGVTTGEWAQTLRDAFGEYRGPTGVRGAASAVTSDRIVELRKAVDRVSDGLGHRIKFLVGKPGLDGHSNGAEQIAVRARDAGMEVVYGGIRLTPAQIAESAAQEDVDVIGLSILSGSHAELIPDVLSSLRDAGAEEIPVVVGGIIPDADATALREAGVAAVYTPKDWDLNQTIGDIVALVAERNGIGSEKSRASL
jgi:ethylmalonyl-CoA mutase